jgi:hypothetical protein
MKKILLAWVLSCGVAAAGRGQTDVPNRPRGLPIIATVQFHALALPFRDFKANLANVGFGLGTEVGLNRRRNWVQQVHVLWFGNRAVGNGLLGYTQNVWRPTLAGRLYAEVKAGAGYLVAFRPVPSYKPVHGEWVAAGRRGKGLFAVHVGVSLGYQPTASRPSVSPFVSYQVMAVTGYNPSIPLVPQTLLQVGSRIHLGK